MANKYDLTRKNPPTKSDPRRSSATWKRRVAKAKSRARRDPAYSVCWLCREPIDAELPGGHRDGFTLDHVVPLGRGGDIDGEALPAHLRCNASRGDGRRRRDRDARPPTILAW